MSTPSTFRRLWQPPARYADRPTDRRVTFLELFFDLVFVVVISQLARRLAQHPTWGGAGWFVFLFYAVWSSWNNGTQYHDLHGTDDVSARVFTFGQMLAVAVMAAFIADVPGAGSDGFAWGFAANTLLLVILWFRTGVHDPHHRPASVPYSIAYLISALLFITSTVAGDPARYWLWAVALAVQLAGLIVAFRRWTPPESQSGEAVIATTPSLIERYGLFVIIVLGEVIVGAVNGMAQVTPLSMDEVVIGLLGVLVAIGLWWIYFDLISHREPVSRLTQVYLHLHFPLVVAIAAGGAGVLNTVEHAADTLPGGVRWLLVGSLATALVFIAAISRTLQIRRRVPEIYRPAEVAIFASAVLILGVGLTDWQA
ncbi:MAG TPA: low temperature requirement protein A, partial [Actinomycetota bacterium]|nr:low temperature requirement protein A [Actinomycetota bacterium]